MLTWIVAGWIFGNVFCNACNKLVMIAWFVKYGMAICFSNGEYYGMLGFKMVVHMV